MSVAPAEAVAEPKQSEPQLVEVRELSKWFPVRGGFFSRVKQHVRAVDQVSFSIAAARTLGLVGESGCGKTTVGRAILRLVRATGGQVLFEGRDVFQLPRDQLRELRRRMQIIFQDPYGSLNPRMTVGASVGEPLVIHRAARGRKLRDRVAELLDQVGLNAEAMSRYPHEFSGGQRQRIGIARALALNPSFIVCDEPTSALDVSIRAQVLNLLADLQQQRGIAYLVISHDLAAVRHTSHQVAVMYLGRIVELADTESLFEDPRHPYTRVLLAAIPQPNPSRRRRKIVVRDDEIPSPINLPSGCPFHPRCPLYELKGRPEVCRRDRPELLPIADRSNHLAACHFASEAEAEQLLVGSRQ
jgi:oligopeptide/dipeptide ABC transporter ATP-binding protein